MTNSESTDIFSLSNEVLSQKLCFVEEIGYGNWGSVWLCRPQVNPASPSADGLDQLQDTQIAVKLVHRSKTPTTAARVRSLWNEMKIIRSFKNDPHPSIIPFHSFIITPSYALITMAYLPTLVPVEVEEWKAKEWFRLLLSGVEFLHKRGVVHNDIKPANILLSHRGVPVLVDFGFAEKYDRKSPKAFHSNLAYGTPEYLSPERARGLPHDTRKSDVWALGITFFEILMGRTPFEYSDNEKFSTKEHLEKYWSRTLRGKWVGSWKISTGMEKLLRRMIAPNADLRCTATEAMGDSYWRIKRDLSMSHRRSASATSSIVFEDMSRLLNVTPPWLSKSGQDKENQPTSNVLNDSPPDLGRPVSKHATMMRSKSQPKISGTQSKKRALLTPLSPVKASPPTTPASTPSKEKSLLRDTPKRKPGNVSTARILDDSTPVLSATKTNAGVAKDKAKNRKKALMDLTGLSRNLENVGRKENAKGKDLVKERVKDWERERERLREIAALEEMDREEELATRRKREKKGSAHSDKENDREMENRGSHAAFCAPRGPERARPQSALAMNTSHEAMDPRPEGESILRGIRQNVKMSIDKTLQLCKASTLSINPRSFSFDRMEDAESRMSYSMRQSWEDDTIIRDAKSSLPVIRHAIRNQRVAADNKIDRMTIWMQNVEKVVEDARQTFASANVTRLPPLPLAPLSRSASQNRSSRLPRKPLAADQIFMNDGPGDQSLSDPDANKAAVSERPLPQLPSDTPSFVLPHGTVRSPPRQRRATVSTCSPTGAKVENEYDPLMGSPSKRKEKCRSQGNLMQPISPISRLEYELQRECMPAPTPRLSAVLDRSLFITPPLTARDDSRVPTPDSSLDSSSGSNDLLSSPLHVEPYPPRKVSCNAVMPDTPSSRRLEGVYDRFLMATSGVKRVGRGYQSDNAAALTNNPIVHPKRNPRFFASARRRMPPPVSSEDQLRASSFDELGAVSSDGSTPDDKDTTAALVRRAFKAIIAGTSRTISRREL